MKLLSRLTNSLAASPDEHRANLNGLNMFFGAVLGFVITGIEQIEGIQFAVVLALCSAIVMCILYVSASRNRWIWAAVAAVFILAIPRFMPDGMAAPQKLQPTFAVWLLLTVFVEVSPRQKRQAAPAEEPA